MKPPVHCPHCGAIFVSRHYTLPDNVQNLQLGGNTETCIRCGRHGAQVSEGVFNVVAGSIEVLTAPDVTRAMLQQLGMLAEQVSIGIVTPSEAVTRADAIKPGLGSIVGRWLANNALGAAALAVAIYGLNQDQTDNRDDSVQAERMIAALERLSDNPHDPNASGESHTKDRKARRAEKSAKGHAPKGPARGW